MAYAAGPDPYSATPPEAMRYGKTRPPVRGNNPNSNTYSNGNRSGNGNVQCWKKVRDLPNGGMEFRLADPIKGNYQVFVKKLEICRLAWLEYYNKELKAKYREGLVMGFDKGDPEQYRKSPIIRIHPR